MRKYNKKKYNFTKFLSYLLVLYAWSISIFIVIWRSKNNDENAINNNRYNKTLNDRSNDDSKNKINNLYRNLVYLKNKDDLTNLFIIHNSLNYSIYLYPIKIINVYDDSDLSFKDSNISQESLINCLKREVDKKEKKKNFSGNPKEENEYRLLQSFINNISNNPKDVFGKLNDTEESIFDSYTNNNLTNNNSPTTIDIQNIIFIQGSIILIETLLLISFVSFSFVKIRFKYFIYKLITFFCSFNNFIQFQILALIFTKISKNDFHSRFTVPYIHSATTIFFTIYIDSDYILNSSAALISGILIIVFSIGYDWSHPY